MLTHDCDYDKKSSNYVIFAEIRPLSEVDKGSQGNIRTFRTRHTFYLTEIPDVMEESYVDLRRIDRVHKPVVTHKATNSERIASLTDEAREALQGHIALFFGIERTEES